MDSICDGTHPFTNDHPLKQSVIDDLFVVQARFATVCGRVNIDVSVADPQQLALSLGEPMIAGVRQALWTASMCYSGRGNFPRPAVARGCASERCGRAALRTSFSA